jgi:hypothetical protein
MFAKAAAMFDAVQHTNGTVELLLVLWPYSTDAVNEPMTSDTTPLSLIVACEPPESMPPVSVEPERLTGKDVPLKLALLVTEVAAIE